MKKKIVALEAQLQNAQIVARSAIYGMEDAARFFKLIHDVEDPDPKRLKTACEFSANSLTRLAAEYTAKLDGVA